MGRIGFPELMVILAIVIIIFGASRLPEIGRGIGSAIRNFKNAASGDNQIEVSKKKEIAAGQADEEVDVARKQVADKKRS